MATEVFNRIGEAEIHSENSRFNKRFEEKTQEFETTENPKSLERIEQISKPLIDAKKEFFESLEDDSLTIDTCEKANFDWKKK